MHVMDIIKCYAPHFPFLICAHRYDCVGRALFSFHQKFTFHLIPRKFVAQYMLHCSQCVCVLQYKWKCEERTISSEPLKNPTLWRRELNKTNWNLMVLLTYEQSRKNLSTWIIAPLGIVPANWKLATSETDKQCNRPQFITIFQIGPNAIAISLSYIISTYTPRRIAYFVGAILCCVKWLDSSFVRFIFLEFHLSSYSIALVMRKAVNNLRPT